jgi:hypothetical protein
VAGVLTALARRLEQKFTVDYDRRIGTFGPLPFKKTRAGGGPSEFGKQFMEKRRNLGDKPYYEPLELPPASAAPPK